jgi:hypothetical protein
MFDPTHLYPDSYHPIETDRSRNFVGQAKHFTRTQKPCRYYLVDFGLSRRYSPDEEPRESIIRGGDKTAPEFKNPKGPIDPFPTDVYYLGNMIREDFLEVR